MFKGRDDWFEMWVADRESMFNTMVRNMAADLEAGYHYYGNCITRQREAIEAYKAETDAAMDKMAEMDEKQINRWCYFDMLKRGVISA